MCRVAVVNQLARQLLHVDHPNSEEIVSRQNQLNSKWSLLREKSELKREELISAHGVQVQYISLNLDILKESVLWIRNDLFQIRLRICRVPDPDPTYVRHICKLLKNKHHIINQKEESTSTNYLLFSNSHYSLESTGLKL